MYLSSNKLGLKPVDGKWMIGFTAIRFPKGNNSREYLVGKLSKPCKANTTYQISFFLSPRNGCDKGAGALGIWLTNGVTSSGNFNSNFSIKPQLTFTTEDLTQKGVWQKFELEFIASGNEVYFVIGNFNNDAETVAVQLSGNTKKVEYWENYYSAFYFIDAVSVIEVPTKTPSTLFQK